MCILLMSSRNLGLAVQTSVIVGNLEKKNKGIYGSKIPRNNEKVRSEQVRGMLSPTMSLVLKFTKVKCRDGPLSSGLSFLAEVLFPALGGPTAGREMERSQVCKDHFQAPPTFPSLSHLSSQRNRSLVLWVQCDTQFPVLLLRCRYNFQSPSRKLPYLASQLS